MEIEGDKYCGEIGTPTEIPTPFSVITNTNDVNLIFHSDGSSTRTGFLAIWSATTEPPTTRTRRVSCGQHSAVDCSQCPYDGDTWVGEGWCHGDCHWRDEDQQCVISTTGDDLDIIYTTASPMTATTPTSSNRLESLRTSTIKPIAMHNKDENSKTTSKIDEENVIKSPNYPLQYPIYSHQVTDKILPNKVIYFIKKFSF